MRMVYRILLVGCLCVVLAGLGLLTLSDPKLVKRLAGLRGIFGVEAWIAVGLGRAAIGCRGHGFRVAIPAARLHFSALQGQQFRDGRLRHGKPLYRADRGRGSIEPVCAAIATRAERGINACLQN